MGKRKQEPIIVKAYVKTADGGEVDVDTLSDEQREKLGQHLLPFSALVEVRQDLNGRLVYLIGAVCAGGGVFFRDAGAGGDRNDRSGKAV